MRGLLILGCGYSGLETGKLAVRDGIPTWGTTRSSVRARELEAAGITPIVFGDTEFRIPSTILDETDSILDTIGPDWKTGHDVTEALLSMLRGHRFERFLYMSSTSVYGDHGGARVTEDSPCTPTGPAGERRLRIEETLRQASSELGCVPMVARVSGIYGPGRSLLHRILDGRYRRIQTLNGYSNRIHVTDLARGLYALLRRGKSGETCILSDDCPALQHEVADHAMEMLGWTCEELTPAEAEAQLTPSHRAMIGDSKFLVNERFKTRLGEPLEFPGYREGFSHLIATDPSLKR